MKIDFLIPSDFFDSYGVVCGWKAILVYIALCRYRNERNICFPGIELLAKKLNISENSVKRGIRSLEDWNILAVKRSRKKSGAWTKNYYILLDRQQWKPLNKTMARGREDYPDNQTRTGFCGEKGKTCGEYENKFIPKTTESYYKSSVGTDKNININNNKYNNNKNNNINKINNNLLDNLNTLEGKKGDLGLLGQEGSFITVDTPAETMKRFLSSFQNKDKVYFALVEYLRLKGIADETVERELEKFYRYWTELNPSGRKQRWEMERVFELPKRLNTWFDNHRKGFRRSRERKGIRLS